MKILVTGAAGFIGFHLSKRLIDMGKRVIGIDSLNNYYDKNLKLSRLKILKDASRDKNLFQFREMHLENQRDLKDLFDEFCPEFVINLAAQAGVRYSIENPNAYISANLLGFSNVLEMCRNYKVRHLIYASSSSVYGGNEKLPFSEKDNVDHPVSLYAASKKSNELMAHAYSHLYQIPTTGLRFFTVYGPWGRPDMALFLFTKAITEGKAIEIFNNGDMQRDFTFIDDIIESLVRLINKLPEPNNNFDKKNPDPSSSWAPYRIFNIGNSNPVSLMNYIFEIEKALGIEAKKNFLPMQPGDVKSTYADTTSLNSWIDFKPNTSIKDGVNKFIKWYLDFYKLH